MQDLLLASFLYAFTFCALCCFVYSPKPVSIQSRTTEPIQADLWMEELELVVTSEPESEIDDVWKDVPEAPAPEENTPDTQEPTIEELLKGIDLEKLQLRSARKICGKLGIQQKVNGKDAPLCWLRGKIKQRLEEKPSEVAPVILEIVNAA